MVGLEPFPKPDRNSHFFPAVASTQYFIWIEEATAARTWKWLPWASTQAFQIRMPLGTWKRPKGGTMRSYLTLHLMDHSFIHSLIHPCIHSFIHSLISFIHPSVHLPMTLKNMVCEPREMARGYSTCHEGVKFWVQIPRTHVKSNMAVHIYNPSAPVVRWKAETGGFP